MNSPCRPKTALPVPDYFYRRPPVPILAIRLPFRLPIWLPIQLPKPIPIPMSLPVSIPIPIMIPISVPIPVQIPVQIPIRLFSVRIFCFRPFFVVLGVLFVTNTVIHLQSCAAHRRTVNLEITI